MAASRTDSCGLTSNEVPKRTLHLCQSGPRRVWNSAYKLHSMVLLYRVKSCAGNDDNTTKFCTSSRLCAQSCVFPYWYRVLFFLSDELHRGKGSEVGTSFVTLRGAVLSVCCWCYGLNAWMCISRYRDLQCGWQTHESDTRMQRHQVV